MKNVRGQELPFNNVEEKQQWYALVKPIPMPIQMTGGIPPADGGIKGKDTSFWEILIPFCKWNQIKTVLDVGADQGRYSAWLSESGMSVTGAELVQDRADLLRYCLDKSGLSNIKTRTLDIEAVTEEELGIFDLIFMSDIVEHLIDWRKGIKTVANSCKYCYMLIPGGRSWDWSEDHLVTFDDELTDELLSLFRSTVICKKVYYDDTNYWYVILVKGMIN